MSIRSNRVIYLLSTIGFFGIFSTTMAKNPVLPLYVHALGQGDAVIGLISAISPLAGMLFSFPVGLMIDRLGKRKLLLISALVFVLAPLLYVFVINPWWLIPIRFFHGLATAILGPLSSVIIFHAYPEKKGEKLGWYSSATLIGRTLAPLIGGAIISYFTFWNGLWNYRFVYILVFLLSLPVLILSLFYHDGDDTVGGGSRLRLIDVWQALKKIVKQTRLFALTLVEMAIYFNFGVLETFLPLYLHDHGFGGSEIGIIFSVQILSIALTKPLFGRLADRTDKRLQIIAGMAILGLAMLIIPLTTNYWVIMLVSVLFGLGMSFATVATNSYVPDIIRREELGASMGALSSLMDVGQSSGPFIIGLVISYLSFFAGFYISLGVIVASSIYFAVTNYSTYQKVVA